MNDSNSLSLEAQITQQMKADAIPLELEFCRIPDLQRLFGIKRGIAYQLIKNGTIRSVSLRRKGTTKGCRLVHVQSVRIFLEKLMPEIRG